MLCCTDVCCAVLSWQGMQGVQGGCRGARACTQPDGREGCSRCRLLGCVLLLGFRFCIVRLGMIVFAVAQHQEAEAWVSRAANKCQYVKQQFHRSAAVAWHSCIWGACRRDVHAAPALAQARRPACPSQSASRVLILYVTPMAQHTKRESMCKPSQLTG